MNLDEQVAHERRAVAAFTWASALLDLSLRVTQVGGLATRLGIELMPAERALLLDMAARLEALAT